MPRRDGSPFAELYEAHAGHVAAFVLRRYGCDGAADIVSDTFVVAWRRRAERPSEPMTRAWLYGVARQVAISHRLGGHRPNRLSERVQAQIAAALRTMPDPESWQAETDDLTEALSLLSSNDRELLSLTAWEELSPVEIAQVLDVPPQLVHKRLFRARQRLAAALDEAAAAQTDSDTEAETATIGPDFCNEAGADV